MQRLNLKMNLKNPQEQQRNKRINRDSQIVGLNPNLSVTRLSVNGLNTPTIFRRNSLHV